MIRKFILLAGLASLVALQAQSANACQVVGRSPSGEVLCMTSSDGAGQAFTDGRNRIPKAIQAARLGEAEQDRRIPKALQAARLGEADLDRHVPKAIQAAHLDEAQLDRHVPKAIQAANLGQTRPRFGFAH